MCELNGFILILVSLDNRAIKFKFVLSLSSDVRMPKPVFCFTSFIYLFLAALFFSPEASAVVEKETYWIRFVHSITNPGSVTVRNVRVLIAVPSDCSSQKILQIKPEGDGKSPFSLEHDQYGQAVYVFRVSRVDPGKTLNFGYSCTAKFNKLLPNDKALGQNSKADVSKGIPLKIKQTYTKDVQRIYDLNNPLILKLARQFLSGYPQIGDRVRAIHYYVASNLKYQMEGNWESAPNVLLSRRGSCSEFSYAFGALCRATGIPTRFVGGSRLRKALPYNDLTGHRWSEVYFPGSGWIAFDPTLDAKAPKKLSYLGTFYQPSLITFRGGGGSSLLGNAYNSTNSKRNQLKRKRQFFWRQN